MLTDEATVEREYSALKAIYKLPPPTPPCTGGELIIKRFSFLCKVGGREVTHLMGGKKKKKSVRMNFPAVRMINECVRI